MLFPLLREISLHYSYCWPQLSTPQGMGCNVGQALRKPDSETEICTWFIGSTLCTKFYEGVRAAGLDRERRWTECSCTQFFLAAGGGGWSGAGTVFRVVLPWGKESGLVSPCRPVTGCKCSRKVMFSWVGTFLQLRAILQGWRRGDEPLDWEMNLQSDSH